ncbi:exo-alpha-sialidase [bacterium]|nr:exo-alpha-sialidase [bacterium]
MRGSLPLTPIAPGLLCLLLGCAPAWRSYEVYQPAIERHFVVNCHEQPLKYNHDSSIVRFGDRWFCLWNANEPPAEGRPGQLNYMSTSPAGRTWSPPVPAFADVRHSENPVPCPKGTQWQPNLIVVDGELWAFWDHNSRDENGGCYFSRLRDPDGKWVNRRLTWDGDTRPLVDGKRFRIFPTQNPVRLRSGRVLAPVTMIGPKAADAPADVKSWWATEKRDSVLYSDDRGATWHVSPGAVQPGRSWAQWEPTVWELDDGTVMMFARNNDSREPAKGGPRPAEMLQWSLSRDGGLTWTPHRPVALETVASRMHVLPAGGDRFVMVHNDWPAGQFVRDRLNLALFFTRGRGVDFVAGPGLTGAEPVVAYPQMWIHDGRLLACYSQGLSYRSIKVVHVEPLPDPRRHYLFPRSSLTLNPVPRRRGDAFQFQGGQFIATLTAPDPGDARFSAGAWVWPEQPGVLLDTRTPKPPAGFVWGLTGHMANCRPFVWLDTKEHNLVSSLKLTPAAWNYVGVTVDNRSGRATLHVNGRSDRMSFTATAPRPLRGTTAYLGHRRFEGSRVPSLGGRLRFLALYAAAALGEAEHRWLHDSLAAALGREPLGGGKAPAAAPVLRFDPADGPGLARDFVLPQAQQAVEVAPHDGQLLLRFIGASSAGVDLDENARQAGDVVDISFRFRIERGKAHVLCTVGDANEPARLVARDGKLLLEAHGQSIPCGAIAQGQWRTVRLSTSGDRTTVSVEGSGRASVSHEPAATWAYFGQGYRTGAVPPPNSFVLDVSSVRTRVRSAPRALPLAPGNPRFGLTLEGGF